MIGVPVIAAAHCATWLWLFGEGFQAREQPSPPPEWSRWWSPRVLALAVLSFPGVLPGFYALVIPLRSMLRDETRVLIGLAVINGAVWGFAWVYLARVVLAEPGAAPNGRGMTAFLGS